MAYGFRRANGVYCAAFLNADGNLERRYTNAKSKAEARRLAERLEAEATAARETSVNESRHWTLGQLIEWWVEQLPETSSAAKEGSASRRILSHPIARKSLAVLKPSDVELFLLDLKEELAPASVKKTLGLVSRAFRLAKRLGKWTANNPVDDVEPVVVPASTIGDHLKPEEVPPLLR